MEIKRRSGLTLLSALLASGLMASIHPLSVRLDHVRKVAQSVGLDARGSTLTKGVPPPAGSQQ